MNLVLSCLAALQALEVIPAQGVAYHHDVEPDLDERKKHSPAAAAFLEHVAS